MCVILLQSGENCSGNLWIVKWHTTMKVQASQEGSDNTQTFSKCREFWEYDHCTSCLSIPITDEKNQCT